MKKHQPGTQQLSLFASQEIDTSPAPVPAAPVSRPVESDQTPQVHHHMELIHFDGCREVVCTGSPGYYERGYDRSVWSAGVVGGTSNPDECHICNPPAEPVVLMSDKEYLFDFGRRHGYPDFYFKLSKPCDGPEVLLHGLETILIPGGQGSWQNCCTNFYSEDWLRDAVQSAKKQDMDERTTS